jgi:antitoxin (DNA-binding transcriptional repressor) of toxin-antitoxin stability system
MSTHKVSVQEARQSLQRLLDDEVGSEVVVLRRGVEVARFIRPERKVLPLPDLGGFLNAAS